MLRISFGFTSEVLFELFDDIGMLVDEGCGQGAGRSVGRILRHNPVNGLRVLSDAQLVLLVHLLGCREYLMV